MAHCKIRVGVGGILKIIISFNVPNKVIDLWEEGKVDEARMELNYHITKHFENLHHKEDKSSSSKSLKEV